MIAIHVLGNRGVYCYEGRPYIRRGPTTQLMPLAEYERRILDKFHGSSRWENAYAPEWVTIKDLDEEELQSTLQNASDIGRMKKPARADSFSILRGLGLVDGNRFLNAAVALYGKSERLFSNYPQLSLRLARFRGSDRLTGFSDNREYWGHAFALLRRSEAFLFDHVPIAGQVVPGKIIREDYPLYPPLGTREAIANAICHRDYTMPGGAVAIAMYDNRLEIINPGILHFEMTPESLSQPHESKPWNPIIAGVFYRAGIIEKWGMGTLNIIQWCKEKGNPNPIWEVRAQSVVTTFLPSLFFSKQSSLQEVISTQYGLRPESRPESRPECLEQAILQLLQEKPLSTSEIAKSLGHTSISGGLKHILQTLRKSQKIFYTIPKKPNSRLQRYKIEEEER